MSPPGRIAVVGASARATAQSVMSAGLEAVAADLFADADLRSLCPATQVDDYPYGLAEWLAAADCDAWLYTGALENHPELVGRMARLKPLLGCGSASLRACRDPVQLAGVAERTGTGFPETVPHAGGQPAAGWLIKSCRGSSGSGVWAPQEWRNLPDESRPAEVYRQRFVPGQGGAAVFVASADGATLLGVSRQLTGEPWTHAGAFQYCGSVAPWALPAEAQQSLCRFADAATERFSLRGVFGIDFVLDGTKAWVAELNPRWTASVEVIERAARATALPLHLAACTGQALPAFPPPAQAAGKAVLFADRPLTLSSQQAGVLLQSADAGTAADVPDAGAVFRQGDPVCTVLAEADDPRQIEPLLKKRAAAVR